MLRIRDLLQVLSVPGGARIFLRRDYDKLSPLMQRIAQGYRRYILRDTRLVAVVGSLGKTTTRAAIAAALDCPDRQFSYSNYGASLAENLLRVRRRDRHAVLEAGISGPGPMAGYARMIRPDIVVVTSISSDHNRSFASLLDTRAEKVKMVSALSAGDIALLNGDDPNVRWMATQTRARVLTFGFGEDNDFRALDYFADAAGRARFSVALGDELVRVNGRLRGRHMVYPLLAAAIVGHLEGNDPRALEARLGAVKPATGRMEIVTTAAGLCIVNDSFKASLESIHAALDAFAGMAACQKAIVIGKIEEPQGNIRQLYRDLGERLASIADIVVAIGDKSHLTLRAAAVRAGMDPAAIRLQGAEIGDAAEFLLGRLQPGDAVLVKGAHAQRLTRVALQLEGRRVACRAVLCDVKVPSCALCPLLDGPPALFANHYIRRNIKALPDAEPVSEPPPA